MCKKILKAAQIIAPVSRLIIARKAARNPANQWLSVDTSLYDNQGVRPVFDCQGPSKQQYSHLEELHFNYRKIFREHLSGNTSGSDDWREPNE